jgi:cytochrome c
MHLLTTTVAAAFLVGCGGSNNHSMETTPNDRETSKVEPAESEVDNGQALADSIMAQWSRQHPDRDWRAEVRRSHPRIPPPESNAELVASSENQGAGDTYGRYTEQDIATWKRETERLVLDGARIFHSGDELGSTVAVSCDMCHPDAANTHAETYPKFQVQMGRVAHLRDMINWCLINPLRAKAMKPDDPRMRALEAYLLAQRKGTPLSYGKH